MQTNIPRFQLAHLGSVMYQYRYEHILSWVFLTLVSLAVGAYLVSLQLQQALDGLRVLCSTSSVWVGRSSRHVCEMW